MTDFDLLTAPNYIDAMTEFAPKSGVVVPAIHWPLRYSEDPSGDS